MNGYFQQGQMSGVDQEEFVYKVPRLMACEVCYRLHVLPNGDPVIYSLSEVAGNSNYGAPKWAWQFTIGPTHPYCYCILFRVTQKKPPKQSAKKRTRRRELLKAIEDRVTLSNTCGIEDDPNLLFEEQLFKNVLHSHEPDPHLIRMLIAIREIYGDDLPN